MIVQNSPTDSVHRFKRSEPPLFRLIYVSHKYQEIRPRTQDAARLAVDSRPCGSEGRSKGYCCHGTDCRQGLAGLRGRVSSAHRNDGTYHAGSRNHATPVRDKDGRLLEVEGIIIDITERKAAEEKIATLARTDGLTGLANRTTFVERLRQAFSGIGRGANPFAILYIDLDHFKDVNDTLGHPVGDQLLQEVSQSSAQYRARKRPHCPLGRGRICNSANGRE